MRKGHHRDAVNRVKTRFTGDRGGRKARQIMQAQYLRRTFIRPEVEPSSGVTIIQPISLRV